MRSSSPAVVPILGWFALLLGVAALPFSLVFGFGCVNATPFGIIGIICSALVLARAAQATNPAGARWLGGLGLAAGLLNLLVGIIGGLFFMDGSW